MEFYHLRSFVVVAETGNLTQAAKRLYSTPPAISAHIKALEEELKTTLFERSSKGMKLTAKGKLLLEQAKNTLSSAQDMVNLAVDNSAELIGEFRLGLNRNAESLKLAQLAEALTQHCPGIQLEVVPLSTGHIVSAIKAGEIHGGYVYGEMSDEFFAIELEQQTITTISPQSFNIQNHLVASDLVQFPWVSVGANCPFDQRLKEKLGSKIQSSFVSSDNESRASMVQAGLGLSFIELEVANQLLSVGNVSRITCLDFQLPLRFSVLAQRQNEPLFKALLQEIRVLWNIAL